MMITPVVAVDGVDGKKLAVYVKHNDLVRDSVVFEIENECSIEILMKDALHIAEVLQIEYEIAHLGLKDKIRAYIFNQLFGDNDDKMFR